MPTWKHHVFVCSNSRPPGHPKGSCAERGSQQVVLALQDGLERHDLWESVKVNTASCLGPCRQGCIVAVYPENVWYEGVTPELATRIVEEHFVHGRVVEAGRLREG